MSFLSDDTVPAPSRASRAGRWLRSLRRLEIALVAATLVILVACVLWGVVTRYVSPRPAAWTGEVAAIAFCWCCLVGSGAFYARGLHPRVFEPARLFIVRLRPLALAISAVVEVTVLALVGFYGALESVTNLDNPTSILRVPGSVYYLPLVWFSLSALIGLAARA